MRFQVCLFLGLFSYCSHAQEKVEFEVSIPTDSVPQAALSSIESIGFSHGHWYKEYSAEDFSYEYKVKYEGRHYSVEFSEDGSLEDVEMRISLKKDKVDLKTLIYVAVQKDAKKFKVLKVQKQWTPVDENSNFVPANFLTDHSSPSIRYEYVVKLKSNGKLETWEYLLEADGTFVSRLKIVEPTINHLEN